MTDITFTAVSFETPTPTQTGDPLITVPLTDADGNKLTLSLTPDVCLDLISALIPTDGPKRTYRRRFDDYRHRISG